VLRAPDLDSALVGKVLDGRYEVLERIGAGGVGEVYRARMLKLDRLVAVKALHEDHVANAQFVARFQREAKAISRMHHPQCVSVLDFGVVQSRPYLVLEYLPGRTVNKLLRDGPLPAARAVGIALQVLDALSYFHRQNVVHRDLKSENLMLVEAGAGKDFVKVLDFGMAKILDSEPGESQLSTRGVVAGTVTAMAPEQIQQLQPDRRIDIYATGILLYEMIVGHRPFRAKEQKEVARMQLHSRPRPPREILGEAALSLELEQVILKALEKERDDRFALAEYMAEALQRTPEGRQVPARPAPTEPEPPAEITVLESLLASDTPEDSASVALPASETADLPRSRRWLVPVVIVLLAALGALVGIYGR
jgi:serine/threonine protein kinase